MHRNLRTSSWVLLLLVSCLNAAQGELLVNGGFELEPNFGSGSVANGGGVSAFAGSEVPGWTIEANHALTIHDTTTYPFIAGNFSANLDGEGFNGNNANFYQDFSSALGVLYALSYDYQGWQFNAPDFTVTVTDLTTLADLYSKTSPWTAALVQEGGSFLGTGNILRLRVVQATTGFNDNAFIVDNFSVNAVPEPSSIALAIASALAGLAFVSRRRRA